MDDLLAIVRIAVLHYCRPRLATYAGGVEAAEDVVQETCVAVFNFLPRYRDQGVPFAAWVFAIAANKVADAQRRYQRAAVLVDEFPDQVEPSPTPEESVVSLDNVRTASKLLNRLPRRSQQVLMLRAEGISADRIGEHLGMSANAVRVAQHRGMMRLRQWASESEEYRELFEHVLVRPHSPDEKIAVGF